jgi:hypothetical protein
MSDVRDQGPVQETATDATSGPKPGTPVIVDVYADDPAGTVSFSHEWRFQGGPTRHGRIDIPQAKKGDPGHPIHYNFHDRTKLGLSFVLDPANVIWVDRTTCPLTQASDPEITHIQPAPHLLKVIDENEDQCLLHYNLRFRPDPDKYYYDPEIRNGGKI